VTGSGAFLVWTDNGHLVAPAGGGGGQGVHDRLCLPGCTGLAGLDNREIQGFARDRRPPPEKDGGCEQNDYGERPNLLHGYCSSLYSGRRFTPINADEEERRTRLSGRAHVTSVAPICWLKIAFVFFFLRWNQQEKDKYVSTDSPSSTAL